MKTVINEKAFFSKTLSRAEIFENAKFKFARGRKKTEVFDRISQSITYNFLRLFTFFAVNVFLSFSCGGAKAFQIRYVSTRIFF